MDSSEKNSTNALLKCNCPPTAGGFCMFLFSLGGGIGLVFLVLAALSFAIGQML